jgi:hypothetical protein
MMKPERVYVGIRRSGQWTVTEADDVSPLDLEGVDFGSDFRTVFASSTAQAEERLLLQVEVDDGRPFHALEYAGINGPGIERMRSAVKAAGYTLDLNTREGSEEQEYGLRARSMNATD